MIEKELMDVLAFLQFADDAGQRGPLRRTRRPFWVPNR